MVLVPCGVASFGCTINTSRVHSRLAPDELDARLRQRFTLGEPGTESVASLRRLGLPYRLGTIPPRDAAREYDHGITADLRPPGLAATDPWSSTSWDRLYLWFDAEDRLERMAHESRAGKWSEGIKVSVREILLEREARP